MQISTLIPSNRKPAKKSGKKRVWIPSTPTIYLHVTDPPVVLSEGGSLAGQHIVLGGARYGRFLFTEACLVEIRGCASVTECVLEDRSSEGCGVRLA